MHPFTQGGHDVAIWANLVAILWILRRERMHHCLGHGLRVGVAEVHRSITPLANRISEVLAVICPDVVSQAIPELVHTVAVRLVEARQLEGARLDDVHRDTPIEELPPEAVAVALPH